jgi:hypothetical protein
VESWLVHGAPDEEESEAQPVEVWWWEVAEAEREFASGLAAGAARGFKDPVGLFALWRREATTADRQRYVEDLIARAQRHLAAGTGARRAE